MREIIFRAWQDNGMVYQSMIGNYALTRFAGFIYEDAPLMQYTGLKDKNSKKIYEGDILQILDDRTKCCIEFRGGCFVGRNLIKSTQHIKSHYSNRNWMQWEVIGNMYETPELLTK